MAKNAMTPYRSQNPMAGNSGGMQLIHTITDWFPDGGKHEDHWKIDIDLEKLAKTLGELFSKT
jgi:hypothetical protein